MEESFCDACGENPCECEICGDCDCDPCACGTGSECEFCGELVRDCECCQECGEADCPECSDRAESNEVDAQIDNMEQEND